MSALRPCPISTARNELGTNCMSGRCAVTLYFAGRLVPIVQVNELALPQYCWQADALVLAEASGCAHNRGQQSGHLPHDEARN